MANVRPTNAFETKSVLDYNKATVLNATRYNCVRAVELDDKQGGAKNTSFLLSMKEMANAILVELGITPVPLAIQKAQDNVELKELQAKIQEQEEELTDQDEEIAFLKASVADLKSKQAPAKKTAAKKKGAK